MLPHQLHRAREACPLVILPVAPLEWHGPHLTVGVDPINAERVALALAGRVGGVVLPTLFAGTERERPPRELESLGFARDAHVIGMDFPKAKGIYPSFYIPEEMFAQMLRSWLEGCLDHGYRHLFIVNGHGAINHRAVIERLCVEFSHKRPGVKAAWNMAFPKRFVDAGSIGHADKIETAITRYYGEDLVDLSKLPPVGEKLKYGDHSIVDSGGFDGKPGEGHTVIPDSDPRQGADAEFGRAIFEETVADLARQVKSTFALAVG
jgi:creatinine amidohydrolase